MTRAEVKLLFEILFLMLAILLRMEPHSPYAKRAVELKEKYTKLNDETQTQSQPPKVNP